ncbi:MAG: site-specific DNA-methyltransferase [Clostridium sp.]|uniref:DNA-methyltransferase n=1 Tax=Clostridium sp. TaxID=1506 RepID=UPI0025C6FAFB|nr:site-specific DNA-methyltransferase [Clostridium sp.]MCE5220219.1 site-specific DNA-methyltransferase [Clostridium sp.]
MIELNKIYNEDFKNGIKLIKDKSIKLVITDPPYLHEKGGRGKMLLCETLDREQFNIKECGSFDENDIYNFLNLTKPLMANPQWYIFCSEKQIVYYLKWCLENKLKYNILTMNKPLSVINRERYSTNIEYIIRIYSNGCALNKIDLQVNKDKTWYYSKYKEYKKPKNKTHPAQKPIDILISYIELSSNENDLILDPFMGSGTTAEACINTHRNFIGFDNGVDEKSGRCWADIANDRIKNIK